jgi:hypothetical protein
MGVGCPAYILTSCLHHVTENLNANIECTILKIYQYFYIYNVRIEQMKE